LAWDFAWRCRSGPRQAKLAPQVRRGPLEAEQPEDTGALADSAAELVDRVAENLEDPAVLAGEGTAHPIRYLPSSIWITTASSRPRNSKPSSR
jgi:hypothetical protein